MNTQGRIHNLSWPYDERSINGSIPDSIKSEQYATITDYLVFVGALVFEFLAPPLDQILTTPGHLSTQHSKLINVKSLTGGEATN